MSQYFTVEAKRRKHKARTEETKFNDAILSSILSRSKSYIMDSDEEIEQFYRNWLLVNNITNTNVPAVQANQNVEDIESASQIVYENNMFQLYVEKGK